MERIFPCPSDKADEISTNIQCLFQTNLIRISSPDISLSDCRQSGSLTQEVLNVLFTFRTVFFITLDFINP